MTTSTKNFVVEGDLRHGPALDIKRLLKSSATAACAAARNLPVRGQRSKECAYPQGPEAHRHNEEVSHRRDNMAQRSCC